MTHTLKTAAGMLGLVIGFAAFANAQAYNKVPVKVTRTVVNKNNVRIIYAESARFWFVFQCNADLCHAPLVGGRYTLRADAAPIYDNCDDYMMANGTDWIAVCVDDVTKAPHPARKPPSAP